jgi:hypothetical protein
MEVHKVTTALTRDPARTPQVSKFFRVFAEANLRKSSIIFTGCKNKAK